ncbi:MULTISPECIES: ATP-binding protein [unclassified Clostridium]|uniref:sensor histidine kinase n=1 Tax=unclassified Clostridium TaxID=2614128 RepID=UPI000297B981|nr:MULTISPECIES: ATP-binding protein [unclassified Clostridium]EKQ55411.1 MAG: histidine kinase [Clostridium sp. Maddingley MBC34-26]
MALLFIDIITSIFQSMIMAYTIYYCVTNKEKNSKVKLVISILIFIFISTFLSGTFGDNFTLGIFVTHILALIVAVLLYRKNPLGTIASYTLIYFTLGIYSTIFGNLIFEYIKEVLPIYYIDYEKIFIVYAPEWILILLCFKYIEKIKQIYKIIVYEKFSTSILLLSFVLDFIVTFYLLNLSDKRQFVQNIAYVTFFMFIAAILVYFWKIHQKSSHIYKLNQALEVKNNELRKIKHDYGAQISYLYGLCLMERFDDLKKSLKDIINNNQSTSTAVEVTENEQSVLSLALKPAIDTGIHVIIDQNCDFKLISMDEMELFRVISNIVNNAIKALNGEGIIIAKSYEYLGNVVIKIENNGPKIAESHLKDIFKVGFTTKENSDRSHGYGLSIVKELVEKHNGKISVKSTDAATEFKIVLPVNNT